MKKFWDWIQNNGGERILRLEGVISEYESWWGDEVTPQMFREDLNAGSGNITVWINSPGGDVFAAAQIYNMLRDYAGRVTVQIDGIAASAASVIAMAGDEVRVSPVAMLMIHNPSTLAWGDSEEMLRAKEMLDEVKESIINAYEEKTRLSRVKIAHLMDDETWMSAKKAVELGFADKITWSEEQDALNDTVAGFSFSRMSITNTLLEKFTRSKPSVKNTNQQAEPKPTGIPVDSLEKRLSLIIH